MKFRLKQLNPFGLRTGLSLGVDISEREVTGVLLMQRKEGAQVIRQSSVTVDSSPSTPRDIATADALKTLLKEFSLSRVSVSISLQPGLYFINRYHFPGASSQKVGELVLQKLEEEKLPFDIESATISYAMQPRAPKGTYIAVCIERSRITPIFSVLHGAGVTNFFLLPPDMSVENCLNLRGEWSKDETLATLRVAAHEAVLTFYDLEGFRLRRIIPIGLRDLFQGVAAKGERDPGRNRPQADALRELSRCSLDPERTEHLDPSDPNKQIFDAVRPVLRRMASSIKKTFHFYETHVGRSSVSTLYLIDDFENLNDIDRFLAQTLQVETRFLEATQHLEFPKSILSSLKTEADSARLAVALGNALEEKGEVSLVPKEELFLPRLRVIRTVCRLTAAVLCLTMVLLTFFYRHGYDDLENTSDYSDALAQQLHAMLQKEQMIVTLKEQNLRNGAVLGGLMPPAGCIARTMKEAGSLVPSFVLLETMALKSELGQASLELTGQFVLDDLKQRERVWSEFINPFEKSPLLENIALKPEPWEEKGPNVMSGFTITADLSACSTATTVSSAETPMASAGTPADANVRTDPGNEVD